MNEKIFSTYNFDCVKGVVLKRPLSRAIRSWRFCCSAAQPCVASAGRRPTGRNFVTQPKERDIFHDTSIDGGNIIKKQESQSFYKLSYTFTLFALGIVCNLAVVIKIVDSGTICLGDVWVAEGHEQNRPPGSLCATNPCALYWLSRLLGSSQSVHARVRNHLRSN